MADFEWKDLGWAKALQTMTELGTIKLKVGLVGSAGEQPDADGRLTLAEVGAINEYGSSTIPPRPWLEQTFDGNKGATTNFIGVAVQKALFADIGALTAFNAVGEWAANQVKKTIDSGVGQRNADATIARKGFDHPLIETQTMRDAIGFEVSTGVGPSLDEGVQSFSTEGIDNAT